VGALRGLKVVELGGIGPVPFAAMILADMGADVVRVSPPGATPDETLGLVTRMRGRRSIVVDVKRPEGREIILRLVASADAMLEGFRPGVLERLGVSPEECWARNERLVIARGTGWGQDGTLANDAGHDINYIALSGVLNAIGSANGPPVIPLNLIGDYASGGWPLAFGVVSGVFEAQRSAHGQVIDVSMFDGIALLMTPWFGEWSQGRYVDERGHNGIDGGAPYYQAYRTADHRYLAVGAVETRFYARLITLLGLDSTMVDEQSNRATWPRDIARLAQVFATKTLGEWLDHFAGEDVCVSAVLSMQEATNHPHARSRGTFVDIDGIVQAQAMPRFSRTPGDAQPMAHTGEHTDEVLGELGYNEHDIVSLREHTVVG